jgi:hypothetical protein
MTSVMPGSAVHPSHPPSPAVVLGSRELLEESELDAPANVTSHHAGRSIEVQRDLAYRCVSDASDIGAHGEFKEYDSRRGRHVRTRGPVLEIDQE